MGKIAVEEHWMNPETVRIKDEWQEALGLPVFLNPDFARGRSIGQRLQEFGGARIAAMDAYGVDVQVLSPATPGVQGVRGAAEAAAKARELNDYQAEAIARFPGRFAGFAAIPLQDPKAAAAELRRAVQDLGFKGAMVHGYTYGSYLDEEQYAPVWQEAEDLGVPIYIHPSETLAYDAQMFRGHPELFGPTWSWGVETATHALRIIFSGVFDRFPGARLVLGHLGEMLPYVLDRLDEGYVSSGAAAAGRIKDAPSAYLRRNLLFSTSGFFAPEALRCAIAAVGIERVLFAADYPFVEVEKAVGCVEATALTDAEKALLYEDNARRLLHL